MPKPALKWYVIAKHYKKRDALGNKSFGVEDVKVVNENEFQDPVWDREGWSAVSSPLPRQAANRESNRYKKAWLSAR